MEKIRIHDQFQKPESSKNLDFKQLSLDQLEKESVKLSDYEESGTFYRGLNADDAFLALFGKLELESDRTGGIIGERDNAVINSGDAIAYGRTSLTKDGRKFICAIGFDLLAGSQVNPSRLGRFNQFRINGPVVAKEVLVRFAGKEPGKPGRIISFSPRGFYEWYMKNAK